MTSSDHRRACLITLVAFAGLFTLGCGGSVQRAPVEGVVTTDGKPVAGIRVTFEPVEGKPGDIAAGVTDDAGRYWLADPAGKSAGAIVGPNRVTLSAYQEDPGDELTPLREIPIPLRFRDGSTITEVPSSGTSNADFAL